MPLNCRPPAACAVSRPDLHADFAAYDALPPELRAVIQDAPFEVDATGVALDLHRTSRTTGSPAMAQCAVAAGLARLMARAVCAAEAEARP